MGIGYNSAILSYISAILVFIMVYSSYSMLCDMVYLLFHVRGLGCVQWTVHAGSLCWRLRGLLVLCHTVASNYVSEISVVSCWWSADPAWYLCVFKCLPHRFWEHLRHFAYLLRWEIVFQASIAQCYSRDLNLVSTFKMRPFADSILPTSSSSLPRYLKSFRLCRKLAVSPVSFSNCILSLQINKERVSRNFHWKLQQRVIKHDESDILRRKETWQEKKEEGGKWISSFYQYLSIKCWRCKLWTVAERNAKRKWKTAFSEGVKNVCWKPKFQQNRYVISLCKWIRRKTYGGLENANFMHQVLKTHHTLTRFVEA